VLAAAPPARGLLALIGNTPLVPLARIARGLPVPVLVKCEHLNPGGSIKDRLALAIVDDAEARGVLRSGMTLVEATAGNTGVGLALVAAARGYPLVCVLPEKMSVDKRVPLPRLGAQVSGTPNTPPTSPDHLPHDAPVGPMHARDWTCKCRHSIYRWHPAATWQFSPKPRFVYTCYAAKAKIPPLHSLLGIPLSSKLVDTDELDQTGTDSR